MPPHAMRVNYQFCLPPDTRIDTGRLKRGLDAAVARAELPQIDPFPSIPTLTDPVTTQVTPNTPTMMTAQQPPAHHAITPAAGHTAPSVMQSAAERLRIGTEYNPETMSRAVVALNAIVGRQALSNADGWLFLQLLGHSAENQGHPSRDRLESVPVMAAYMAEARLGGR